MIKAEEHDTDRAGRLIFEKVCHQLDWVPSRVDDDYGIDYNVQAFSERQPTGAWFQVQLKSSNAPSRSADGTFISFNLSIAHAVHYSLDLKQPLFLLLADISSEEMFWFCPQLNSGMVRKAQARGVESVTFRIPTANTLIASPARLVESLNHVYLLLSAREIGASSHYTFQNAIDRRVLNDEVLQGLQSKQDHLRLLRIAQAFDLGKFEEASNRINVVLSDPDVTIHAKFHALLQLNSLEYRQRVFSGTAAIDLPTVHLKYAERLRTLAGRNHDWIRRGAALVHATALIEKIVQNDAADHMALQIHSAAGSNPMAILGLLTRRAASARNIVRLYNRALQLVEQALRCSEVHYLTNIITRVPTSFAVYLIALRHASDNQTASEFVRSGLRVLDAAVAIASDAGDQRGIGNAVFAAITLVHSESSEVVEWITKTRERLSDADTAREIETALQRVALRGQGQKLDDDYEPDPIWQIIEKVARSRGIDTTDQQSTLVRRLRIAASDDTPERWLRFCHHLLLTPGSISPVDTFVQRELGIQNSSNKVAHCTLYDLHYEAVSAQTAFDLLKGSSCDNCSSRVPRPDSWTYAPQERENEAIDHFEFVQSAIERGKGIKFTLRDDLDR